MDRYMLQNKQSPDSNKLSDLLTIKTNTMEPNPNWSILFVGDADDCSAFGVADGKIKLHIFARDGEEEGAEFVPGNAPFKVKLLVNGEVVRTVENIPALENYAYLNQDPAKGPICDYNCIIENIPAYTGDVRLIVEDCLPEPNDWRGPVPFKVLQPPFATINGEVNPGGLNTEVIFELGTEPDNLAIMLPFGTINGYENVSCNIRLKSQSEGDLTAILLPGTTYYYRVHAINECGESYGEILEFTTPSYACAPVATTLPATYIV